MLLPRVPRCLIMYSPLRSLLVLVLERITGVEVNLILNKLQDPLCHPSREVGFVHDLLKRHNNELGNGVGLKIRL